MFVWNKHGYCMPLIKALLGYSKDRSTLIPVIVWQKPPYKKKLANKVVMVFLKAAIVKYESGTKHGYHHHLRVLLCNFVAETILFFMLFFLLLFFFFLSFFPSLIVSFFSFFLSSFQFQLLGLKDSWLPPWVPPSAGVPLAYSSFLIHALFPWSSLVS